MRMWVTEDRADEVWTLYTESVVLDTPGALEVWEPRLFRALREGLGERRVPLLIDMSGFHLHPSLAKAYGPVAKRVLTNFATMIVRYSPDGELSSAGVRTAAIKNGFPSRICDSRETALKLLKRLRTLPQFNPG